MTQNQLRAFILTSHTALGKYGELLAYDLLIDKGYVVFRCRGCDLIAIQPDTGEVIRVEVKTARMNSQGRFKFNCIKRNHTHTDKADVVICLVYHQGEFTPYVIPTNDIRGKHTVCIASEPARYKGKYRQYMSAWHNVNQEVRIS